MWTLKNVVLVGMLVVGIFATGCIVEEPNETSDMLYRGILQEDTSLHQVANAMTQNEIEEFVARINYSGHQSQVGVVTCRDDIDALVMEERNRLEFLSGHFNADDFLEGPVHEQFMTDIESIDSERTIFVSWVEFRGSLTDNDGIFASIMVSPNSEDTPDGEMASSRHALVTDYTGDAWYVPAGGTSTIYTSGTLQKFWLDSSSKSIINNYNSGLEIDTVVYGSGNATCSTVGVSSNMPGFYADTEFLDSGGNTNCSVGTVNASQLHTWTLYWTWHPFGSFNTAANPYVRVMYQPKSWCWWVGTTEQCESNRPWCMCNMSMYPTEWLIGYNYFDRPGQETSWTKN